MKKIMQNDLVKNSKIGLGTFPFSGVFSEINNEIVEQIISKFFSLGGTYVETAPVYPRNNIHLGKILSKFPRESFQLASKCVTGQDESGNKFRSGKRDHIIRQCHMELKRLNTSYLDLLQSHIVAEDATIEETAEALQYLKDEGFTKEIGVSNVSLSQLKEFSEHSEVKYVQNRFSLIHQSQNRSIENYCKENDIWLNPFQVIERGLLTSHPTRDGKWREKDLRNSKHEYKGDAFFTIRKWVENKLLPIASNENVSLESLIIAWTCVQPQVKICVIGVTKPIQLENIFESMRISLSKEIINEINAAYESLSYQIKDSYNLTIEEFRGLK